MLLKWIIVFIFLIFHSIGNSLESFTFEEVNKTPGSSYNKKEKITISTSLFNENLCYQRENNLRFGDLFIIQAASSETIQNIIELPIDFDLAKSSGVISQDKIINLIKEYQKNKFKSILFEFNIPETINLKKCQNISPNYLFNLIRLFVKKQCMDCDVFVKSFDQFIKNSNILKSRPNQVRMVSKNKIGFFFRTRGFAC